VVRLLLDQTINEDVSRSIHYSVLVHASFTGQLVIMRLLLDPMINDNVQRSIHAREDAAIRMAIHNEHWEIVRFLLDLTINDDV
jgi:hypothetical protein